MKSMYAGYMTVAALCGLVAMMMMIQSSEALTCYSCSGSVGVSDDCYQPNERTKKDVCTAGSNYCHTVFASANSINRGCTNSTQSSCQSFAVYWCEYVCNTDMCNSRTSSATHTIAGTALIATAALALLATRRFA